MAAVLDAAIDRYGDELTVADPFSGGGTVAFESVRRGLKTYAQDLYPWPTRGLESALAACDPKVLEDARNTLLKALEPLRSPYRTGRNRELSHILRVRAAKCTQCASVFFQFPHPMISLKSRGINEGRAYYGCYLCGRVVTRNRTVRTFRCQSCDVRWSATTPIVGCVECGSGSLEPVGWRAVLVQELAKDKHGRWRSVLRTVRRADPVTAQPASAGPKALAALIPKGKETKRLLDHQFLRWRDLYTQRQVDVLSSALAIVKRLRLPAPVKDRLAFCVMGAAEMAAFLSRWDRLHLKCFEALANHRYTQTTLAVETNLLSPIGRGTLPRRLAAATATLSWLTDARSAAPTVVTTNSQRYGRRPTRWDVLIARGTSTQQVLRDDAVNVVLTDPPYCDDVQYGELARLFHAWLRVYERTGAFDERDEAVPNSMRGTSITDYENTIAACLQESRRTLRKDGTLVLTFHNKKIRAWSALASAICRAGFSVRALAIVRAENDADHCKRNVNAMLYDLVLECVPASEGSRRRARLVCAPRTLTEFNLAALGIAVARCANSRRTHQLGVLYRQCLSRWTASEPLVN
jgi:hypothetical protein